MGLASAWLCSTTDVCDVDFYSENAAMIKKLKPTHPGEVLREEFLIPLEMSAGALAKTCGTTAELWLNLQNDYDIQIAKRDLGKALDRIETVNKPKAA
jgi:plasmid maintenance system antidote protein VapI